MYLYRSFLWPIYMMKDCPDLKLIYAHQELKLKKGKQKDERIPCRKFRIFRVPSHATKIK